MTTASAFSVAKNQGDQLLASEANSLNAGIQAALPRSGTTPLTAACTIQGGGFVCTFIAADNAASQWALTVGALDAVVTCSGAGSFTLAADKLKLTGTGWPPLASRSVYTLIHGPPLLSQNFAWDAAKIAFVCSTNNAQWAGEISGPTGAVLTEVQVTIMGDTHAALPATAAIVNVNRSTAAGVVTLTVATASDTAANVGAFNVAHNITVTGLNETIDTSGVVRLTMFIQGPAGANFENNKVRLLGVRCKFTCTGLTMGS